MPAAISRSSSFERRSTHTLDRVFRRAANDLVRAPHGQLDIAIDSTLAAIGAALEVDRALLANRELNGALQRYVWDRHAPNGPADHLALDSIVSALMPNDTIVFEHRGEAPASLRIDVRMLAAAIIAPLDPRGRGVLAITCRSRRCWLPDTVLQVEAFAGLFAAALDRLTSMSSLAREQQRRLQAEAETRKLRDQLAHAGRVTMLGEMAASLAHELKQPLTAVYSNAEAAARLLQQRPLAYRELSGAIDDLRQDCRRAADVISRLREMFQPREADRVALNIGPLIAKVLTLLHEDAVARDINVGLEVRPGLPPVKADHVQLEQVVMNLVLNAFDAVTGLPGPRHVTIRASLRGGCVELAVLDTGRGIAKENLERVFDPFFTSKASGMGMGLAICRTIVEAHGGRIRARNAAQPGSVFEVILPALPPDDVNSGGES